MFEIIGFEKIHYTKKDTGELVNGYILYLKGDKLTFKNSDGYSVLSKYFSFDKVYGDVKVGAFCEFKYSCNSKGEPKITGCTIS